MLTYQTAECGSNLSKIIFLFVLFIYLLVHNLSIQPLIAVGLKFKMKLEVRVFIQVFRSSFEVVPHLLIFILLSKVFIDRPHHFTICAVVVSLCFKIIQWTLWPFSSWAISKTDWPDLAIFFTISSLVAEGNFFHLAIFKIHKIAFNNIPNTFHSDILNYMLGIMSLVWPVGQEWSQHNLVCFIASWQMIQ